MGLDMYLQGEKFLWGDWETPTNDRVEDGKRISAIHVDLGYWRKHPNLHGFIVATFANGVDECQRINLSVDHLKTILAAVKDPKSLPQTEGFFFGESDGSQEEIEKDVKIIEEAIAWAETKEERVSRQVYYRASW